MIGRILKPACWTAAGLALAAAGPAAGNDADLERTLFATVLTFAGLFVAPIVLYRRWHRRTSVESDGVVAAAVAALLAPAIAWQDAAGWHFTLWPGLAQALSAGSWAMLFPLPVMSMLLCTLMLFLVLQRRHRWHRDGGDGAEG